MMPLMGTITHRHRPKIKPHVPRVLKFPAKFRELEAKRLESLGLHEQAEQMRLNRRT